MAAIQGLTQREAEALLYDWRLWARPKQLPPVGDWRIWVIMTGRGWGKTATGSRWLVSAASSRDERTEWAIIAPTFHDARSVCVEGESGLLAAIPPGDLVRYNRATFEVELRSGAVIYCHSAEDPVKGVRGRNLSGAWCDELSSWRYEEVWHQQLMPALRKGDARVLVTTTPRAVPLIKELADRGTPGHSAYDGSVHLTRGSTWENQDNLSALALDELRRRYTGTRLGRQELEGEILDDVEGALWRREQIEACRVGWNQIPAFRRIVVGVDPSGGVAETGIVTCGLGEDGLGYVLDDSSSEGTPEKWARAVADAFHRNQGDRIVAEANMGGKMVESTLRAVDANLPIKNVHASRGKQARAEPVSALYQQGRIRHVGSFPELEDQLCGWAPVSNLPSPDRLDALVWALHELFLDHVPWEPDAPTLAIRGRGY